MGNNVRMFLAGVFLVLGISAANAIAGPFQVMFLALLFGLALLFSSIRAPSSYLVLYTLISIIIFLSWVVSPENYNAMSWLNFLRPVFEGGALALVLFYVFEVKDKEVFLSLTSYFIYFHALFMIVMYVFPDLRVFYIEFLFPIAEYDSPAFQHALTYRGVGFSKHLLYGFPLLTGLIASIFLICGDLKKTRDLVVVALAVVLTLLNARIGLIPILMYLILSVTLFFSVRRVLFLFLTLIISLSYIWLFVKSDNVFVYWLSQGISQFYSNESSTTIIDLKGMLFFPETWQEVLFGRGQVCLKEDASNCYSDIGFIRLTQLSGVSLVLLLSVVFYCASADMSSFFTGEKKSRNSAFLRIILLGTFFAGLMKGDLYYSSDMSRFIFLIIFLNLLVARNRYIQGDRRCL